MTTFRIAKLAELVGGWGQTTQVRTIIEGLTDEVLRTKEEHRGAPLPEEMVAGRLPPGIKSAWIFVIRPKTVTTPHRHPNSVQHSAFLSGQGVASIGNRKGIIQPFDPAYPEKSVYVIPEGVPHSFEAYNEPIVVLSFHTVAPQELIEQEVGSGKRRRYVDEDGTPIGRPISRPARPIPRPARPVSRPARPAVRPAKPVGGNAKPGTRTARPAGRDAKPANRSARPGGRPQGKPARPNRPSRPGKPTRPGRPGKPGKPTKR